jgi:hypothetical protein
LELPHPIYICYANESKEGAERRCSLKETDVQLETLDKSSETRASDTTDPIPLYQKITRIFLKG